MKRTTYDIMKDGWARLIAERRLVNVSFENFTEIVRWVKMNPNLSPPWISVDDKLPGYYDMSEDMSDAVYVITNKGFRTMGCYDHEEKKWHLFSIGIPIKLMGKVKYWMPLIDPPK